MFTHGLRTCMLLSGRGLSSRVGDWLMHDEQSHCMWPSSWCYGRRERTSTHSVTGKHQGTMRSLNFKDWESMWSISSTSSSFRIRSKCFRSGSAPLHYHSTWPSTNRLSGTPLTTCELSSSSLLAVCSSHSAYIREIRPLFTTSSFIRNTVYLASIWSRAN